MCHRIYMQDMTIETIIENFALLEDWEDRYRYLIELGREMPPFPEEARVDVNKVNGCVSQVWVIGHRDAGPDGMPVLYFQGDSDSHLVRGLVAVMVALYSGKNAREILDTDTPAVLESMGLRGHLTPQRSNGLNALVTRMRQMAAEGI